MASWISSPARVVSVRVGADDLASLPCRPYLGIAFAIIATRTYCYLEPIEHWTGARSLLRNPELGVAVDSYATRLRSTATGYIRYTLFSTRLRLAPRRGCCQGWWAIKDMYPRRWPVLCPDSVYDLLQ